MKPSRQRLYLILLVLAALGVAAGIALYALKDTVSFFHSPLQVHELQRQKSPRVAVGHVFRLGGLVKTDSLQKRGDDLSIVFVVTDQKDDITVTYTGLLPDLFREGQGVVAKGALNESGVFVASELLAKHDENYMPPEVAKALKEQHDR